MIVIYNGSGNPGRYDESKTREDFSAGTWIQPRITGDSKVMVIDGWLVEVVHKYRCMMTYVSL